MLYMDSPLWVFKLSTSGSETCQQIISRLSTWIQFPQSFPFDVEDSDDSDDSDPASAVVCAFVTDFIFCMFQVRVVCT